MNPNKLAKMRCTIIKNIYLSEMEIDKINLKAQLKFENQLSNLEGNSNSSHSAHHHRIQVIENIESQNTLSIKTYVNLEQISNNIQNGLSPEVLNIDP